MRHDRLCQVGAGLRRCGDSLSAWTAGAEQPNLSVSSTPPLTPHPSPTPSAVRDLLAWAGFINATAPQLGILAAYAHGAHLVLLDGIGLGVGLSAEVGRHGDSESGDWVGSGPGLQTGLLVEPCQAALTC